jgi:hypothetical protein
MVTKKKVAKKTKVKVKAKAKTKTKKKVVAKPAKKNYLMMVLDESSSMESIKAQAISAFNEQIKTVKESKGQVDVCVDLVKFSSLVSIVFENEKIEDVRELTKETYAPNTMTAMYDGVGKAIELLKSRPDINDPNVTVLMLIISDGQENVSRNWTAQKLAEELKSLQATGRWTVTYAGANQDLTQISQTLNIPLGNTSAFVASAAGMQANNVLRSKSARGLYSSYSQGITTQSVNFYNQPDEDKEDDSTQVKS